MDAGLLQHVNQVLVRDDQAIGRCEKGHMVRDAGSKHLFSKPPTVTTFLRTYLSFLGSRYFPSFVTFADSDLCSDICIHQSKLFSVKFITLTPSDLIRKVFAKHSPNLFRAIRHRNTS